MQLAELQPTMADERKQIGARLSKDLVAKLNHVAIDRDVTLNDLIEHALVDWYKRQPEHETYGDVALAEPPKAGKPHKQPTPKIPAAKTSSKTSPKKKPS